MKRKVTIVIIDDENLKSNVRSLEMKLNKICEPEIITIYTQAVSLRKDGDTDHLDPEKLYNKILSKIEGKHIDWFVTDFNIGEEYIDGIDIVREISNRRNFYKKNIILYSGNIERAIEKILDENEPDLSKQGLINAVKKLYDLPIRYYEKRNDYKERLLKVVTEDLEPTLDEEFIKLLYENGEMIFSSCFPPFSGMKLKEIAQIIENDSDYRSREWRAALIEQTISYLLKVNE